MAVSRVNSELLDVYLKKSGLLIGYICEQLGLSREGFAKKRRGETPFKGAEVYVLCDLLKIPESDKPNIFLPLR